MTLLEYVKGMPEYTIINIGTAKGSNWFFIGYAKEFLELSKDEIDDKFKASINSVMRHYEKKIFELKYPEEARKHKYAKTLKAPMPEDARLSALHKYEERYKIITNYVNNYKPVRNRNIVASYNSISDPSICIVVDGIENGKLWIIDDTYKYGTVAVDACRVQDFIL